jgi:fermentation-respiration switch protein FrsA (DUF1100 family)
MQSLKWIALFAFAGYAGLIALMYVAQRALMYFPDTRRTAPADVGLPQAQEVVLDTTDGERVIAWHVPPRGDRPAILYFQGNGGAPRHRVARFRALADEGLGLVALAYRGYAGSSGSPSETGLIADAAAAYTFAAARYPVGRIVLWGESLGTAVAVALAAEHEVAALILESPFTSIVDVAASIYPFAPVRWLTKDSFRSDLRIGKVRAPMLFMHGELDRLVRIRFGEALFALAPEPKEFVRLADAGHEDHDDHGAIEVAKRFLDRVGRAIQK